MKRRILLCLVMVLSLQWAPAKDFRGSYTLTRGGQIIIENILGNIKVRGTEGAEIEIIGRQKSEEGNPVEILDSSFGNRIEIRLRPDPSRRSDARVDFEVRVPGSIEYNFSRISTFSGNVDIAGVTGRLRAESVRGNVVLAEVKGMVRASSFSGNIKASIENVQDRGNMSFATVSGNIDVAAPASLDALVDITCPSGQLRIDFPLEIQESRYGPGRSARGRLGTGKQILHMRSVSGRVSLTHK